MTISGADGREPGAPHRTAIIVVHGVGNTKPGQTLNYVVDEVAARTPGAVASSFCRVRWLEEPAGVLAEHNETFPVHERDLRLGNGTEATAFELYWADLTQMRGGGILAGLGVLRSVFEMPHVVDALLTERAGVLGRLLRWMLLLATCFLRGPLAGFCATLFAGGFVFLSYAMIPNREPINGALAYLHIPIVIPYFMTYQLYFVTMMLATSMFGFWVFIKNRTRDIGWADVGLFSGLSAVGIICDLLVRTYFNGVLNAWLFNGRPVVDTIDWTHSGSAHLAAFKLYYPYLTQLWTIWAAVVSVSVAIYILMFLTDAKGRAGGPRGAGAAIGLTVLQASAWLAVVPVLAVLQIDSLRTVFTTDFDKQMYGAVQTIAMLGDDSQDALRRFLADYKASSYGMDRSIHNALRELTASFLWNSSILMALGFGCGMILMYRQRLARSALARAAAAVPDWTPLNARMPRLIVHSRLILFLILLGIAQAVLIFARVSEDEKRIPEVFIPIGIAVAGALLVIIKLAWGWLAEALGGVLHIAQDLIDHHYRTRIGFSGFLRRSTHRDEINRHVRRERIANRMNKLVRSLIEKRGFDDVMFLAHSQGSVIVFDFLRSVQHQGGLLGCYRPYVLTAGAPLGHLYQHYFDEYRELDRQLEQLRPTVSRWVNVYRCDDPIGGPIGPLKGDFPVNAVLKPGGHLAYWEVADVGDFVSAMLEDASQSDNACVIR